MKLANLFTLAKPLRAVAVAAFAFLSAGVIQAGNFFDSSNPGGINLGQAKGGTLYGTKGWTIFSMSGGVTITDPDTSGTFATNGNIALGGNGSFTVSNSTIIGTVYRQGTGGITNSGGTITGNGGFGGNTVNSTFSSDISTGVSQVTAASATAGGLSPTTSGLSLGGGVLTGGYGTAYTASNPLNYTQAINLNNTAGSISASSAGTYVLNLTDLILAGTGAILTLNGNGTSDAVNYVVNVNRYLTLSTAAQIKLGNGLTSANVLFNVRNNGGGTQYDVTMSGGSQLNGILMAPTRNVKLTGASVVYGEVIGKGVSLSGRSKVLISP